MNDLPMWLERRKSERTAAAKLLIANDGVKFFADVLGGLGNNTRHLPRIGFRGQTSNLSTIADREQRCRVDVGGSHGIPSITYTDLLYTLGSGVIRSVTREGEHTDFHLCVLESGELGVIPDGEFIQLTAKELAERLVESAVDRLSEVA